jgi:hypothetical protein
MLWKSREDELRELQESSSADMGDVVACQLSYLRGGGSARSLLGVQLAQCVLRLLPGLPRPLVRLLALAMERIRLAEGDGVQRVLVAMRERGLSGQLALDAPRPHIRERRKQDTPNSAEFPWGG